MSTVKGVGNRGSPVDVSIDAPPRPDATAVSSVPDAPPLARRQGPDGLRAPSADVAPRARSRAPSLRPGLVALVQYNPEPHFADPDTNNANLHRHALAAVRKGANVIVFPEGSIFGYDDGRQAFCRAGAAAPAGRACVEASRFVERVPEGPTTQRWRAFAMEHGVYLVISVMEQGADGRYFNTIVALAPDGTATPYRKRAMYSTDAAYASPGPGPAVLDTPYGRFGLLVCMDGMDHDRVEFGGTPTNMGHYREYRRLGVDGIIIPMNWGNDDPKSPWSAQRMFARRARQNGVALFAADAVDGTGRYGVEGRRTRTGLSQDIGVEGVSYHRIDFRRRGR